MRRLENACAVGAYLVLPLAGFAKGLRLPWAALVRGVAAFPIAVKGRIGGFIQGPLAIGYVAIVIAAIVQLIS